MTTCAKGQFPRAQKLGTFLAHETKPRRSKRRKGLSKLALRLLPSSQFCIDLRSVFPKLWLTPDPRNDERRRNLHQTGRISCPIGRLIPWRRARTLRETSKKVFYAHLCQPDRINMIPPARHPSKSERKLIEILMGIADVRIFRLVTDLRRKFRIAGVNVWNIRRQNGVIASPPNWKRKCQNLD